MTLVHGFFRLPFIVQRHGVFLRCHTCVFTEYPDKGIVDEPFMEMQSERKYGILMKEPCYEKAVLDRIQRMIFRDINCTSVVTWNWQKNIG